MLYSVSAKGKKLSLLGDVKYQIASLEAGLGLAVLLLHDCGGTEKFFNCLNNIYKIWGHAVAQLVEALRYKPEGRRFDSR